MLVLRRKTGEALLIGDNIEIEFFDVSELGVKIGIKAPKDMLVLRKELQTNKTLEPGRLIPSDLFPPKLDAD